MQIRQIGPLRVSAIGLGCMGMTPVYGEPDQDECIATLHRAIALGVSFIDTADMYGAGHNEELIGRFLKGRRDRIVLATKFGIVRQSAAYARRIDNTPAYIRSACDASLRRLGVDTIDLYYMHRRNPEVPIAESVGAMAELVKAGKVRSLGLSEVAVETLRAAHKVHPIAAVQSEYSLWTRGPEDGMLDACRELGVTFVAYSPLGRALLTGKLASTDDLAPDDFRRHNPRFQGEAFAANKRLADGLAALAAELKITPAQLALAWQLGKHPHVVPIPGTRRATHLAENITASEIALAPATIARLDALFAPEAVAGERYVPEGMKGVNL